MFNLPPMLTTQINAIASEFILQSEESHISISGNCNDFSYKYSYILGPVNSNFFTNNRRLSELKFQTKSAHKGLGINYFQNHSEQNFDINFRLVPKSENFSANLIYNSNPFNDLILSLEIPNPVLSKYFNISKFQTQVNTYHELDWSINGAVTSEFRKFPSSLNFKISSQSNIFITHFTMITKYTSFSLLASPTRQLFSICSDYFPCTKMALTFPFSHHKILTVIPEIIINPNNYQISKSNNYKLLCKSIGLKYDWSNHLFILKNKCQLKNQFMTIDGGLSLTRRDNIFTLAYGGKICLNEKAKDYKFFLGKTEDSNLVFKVGYDSPSFSFVPIVGFTIGPMVWRPNINLTLDLKQ